MQATIREHRDNGHAGGVFAKYNVVKVLNSQVMSLLVFLVLYFTCKYFLRSCSFQR